ncbi:MAG TPA: ATP synthase F1 subunit delta [Clostridiales bacterium UBA8960]|jgi:F-type H+-transporting ATPase subunit delta|nr:ATP synthase F1 subunit delta [Clostridiales bacterium UBA8960]
MAELVSKTYSEAIFDVAIEEGRLIELQQEFEFVGAALKAHPDFFEIIKTPKINIAEKKAVLQETFGNQVSQTLLNFLKIIIDKNRGTDILDIKRDFDERVNVHHGVVKATVESVIPLTEDQLEHLTDKLKAMTGKKVEIVTFINPELLGGLVIKLGDRIIDGSVKFKLQGMLEGLTQIII